MPKLEEQQTSELRKLYLNLTLQIERARHVVYELDDPTKLEHFRLPEGNLFVKREDSSIVHSYKWRGAFFKMHQLVESGNEGPFVAASAGNHAQGVAIAANHLGVPAIIFMPRSTPQLKQDSVARFGKEFVEVRLHGDSYDDAADEAARWASQGQATMVRPFDDISVIAGQATVGLEMLDQNPDLTRIYVPIGGGGLASAVGFVAKVIADNDCKIIGVEVENQNSMQRSMAAGRPVSMAAVDRFCDGTAVRQPGEITFQFCQKLLDGIVTVTNQEVSSAIKTAWEFGRFIAEPSGAIGMAAAIKYAQQDTAETVGTIVTGSNTDFKTLPRIVNQSNASNSTRKYFRFTIRERNGSLIELLDEFLTNINIVDFQYGKCQLKIATPVLGLEGPAQRLAQLSERLRFSCFGAMELPDVASMDYRVIPFRPELWHRPFFWRIDFPDRPGALREFMRRISDIANICYFNFVDTGESEGHALIGFEPLLADTKVKLAGHLVELNLKFRQFNPIQALDS